MDTIERKLIAAAKEFYGEEDTALVRALVTEEWGDFGLRGYAPFHGGVTVNGQEPEYIARLDDFCIYGSDIEAAKQARKDGIKLIPYKEQPKKGDLKYYRFTDTPENRRILGI